MDTSVNADVSILAASVNVEAYLGNLQIVSFLEVCV